MPLIGWGVEGVEGFSKTPHTRANPQNAHWRNNGTTLYTLYTLNPGFGVFGIGLQRTKGDALSRTAPPAPLTDGRYWRRLLATCHPDKPGGDHDLFVFLQGLREHVEGCLNPSDRGCGTYTADRGGRADRRGSEQGAPDRVPFDGSLPFDEHTRAILARRGDFGEPHAHVLGLLIDCADARHGRAFEQQSRGATWKQVAAVAHAVGMSYQQRQEWYKVAVSVQLSQRHCGHILGRLQKKAA
jgi:hypothetical protein